MQKFESADVQQRTERPVESQKLFEKDLQPTGNSWNASINEMEKGKGAGGIAMLKSADGSDITITDKQKTTVTEEARLRQELNPVSTVGNTTFREDVSKSESVKLTTAHGEASTTPEKKSKAA